MDLTSFDISGLPSIKRTTYVLCSDFLSSRLYFAPWAG